MDDFQANSIIDFANANMIVAVALICPAVSSRLSKLCLNRRNTAKCRTDNVSLIKIHQDF